MQLAIVTIIVLAASIVIVNCVPNMYFELVEKKVECLMYNGTCVDHCPENMQPVHSRCQPTYSQVTCDEPRSMPLGIICDWSRCDCDFPFVLHVTSGYCFLLEDCP